MLPCPLLVSVYSIVCYALCIVSIYTCVCVCIILLCRSRVSRLSRLFILTVGQIHAPITKRVSTFVVAYINVLLYLISLYHSIIHLFPLYREFNYYPPQKPVYIHIPHSFPSWVLPTVTLRTQQFQILYS